MCSSAAVCAVEVKSNGGTPWNTPPTAVWLKTPVFFSASYVNMASLNSSSCADSRRGSLGATLWTMVGLGMGVRQTVITGSGGGVCVAALAAWLGLGLGQEGG